MQRARIEGLLWELSVLSRAVVFKNLSEASRPLRISQPQLSRLVARIEQELSVSLLDRSSRRNSAWTPLAQRMGVAYREQLESASLRLERVARESEPRAISIGTLEGVADVAAAMACRLLSAPFMHEVTLMVGDLTDLESQFLKGDLDLLLSFREPGTRKFRYRLELGYQTLDRKGLAGATIQALSPFERQLLNRRVRRPKEVSGKQLITNSLIVRRWAIDRGIAAGNVPSPISDQRLPGGVPVILLGQETCTPGVWNLVKTEAYGSTIKKQESKAEPRYRQRIQKESRSSRP